MAQHPPAHDHDAFFIEVVPDLSRGFRARRVVPRAPRESRFARDPPRSAASISRYECGRRITSRCARAARVLRCVIGFSDLLSYQRSARLGACGKLGPPDTGHPAHPLRSAPRSNYAAHLR
jgi:hypothetical protein